MFECVRGTDKDNAKQVLYLLMAWADGTQWVAVHGAPKASYDKVALATSVFGSADKGILVAGNHGAQEKRAAWSAALAVLT